MELLSPPQLSRIYRPGCRSVRGSSSRKSKIDFNIYVIIQEDCRWSLMGISYFHSFSFDFFRSIHSPPVPVSAKLNSSKSSNSTSIHSLRSLCHCCCWPAARCRILLLCSKCSSTSRSSSVVVVARAKVGHIFTFLLTADSLLIANWICSTVKRCYSTYILCRRRTG